MIKRPDPAEGPDAPKSKGALKPDGARAGDGASKPDRAEKPEGMSIPAGRMMPREERLRPPQWTDGRTESPNRRFNVVGKRNRKVEGVAKVTGRAIYADDLVLPRMLHGKLLRSIHAHANILSIDASAALAMPGVHAVITGKDLPTHFGIIPWTEDEQALAEHKASYVGDAIAAVAADSELIAEEALRAIKVEYEPLPAVMDIDTALEHPEWKVNVHAREGNVSKHVYLEFGDVDGGLAASDAVVEAEYWYEGSTHAPIEPHCALADFDGTGFLTLYSSTQVAHYLHRDIAKVLGLATQRVRVIQPVVGGAFGGRASRSRSSSAPPSSA
jgi:CO/xanthine dehydrogenase Mo-binding subunit